MMFWNTLAVLLEGEADAGSAGTGGGTGTGLFGGNNWLFFVILIALIVLLVVWFLVSGRKNKQKQKEYTEQLAALGPGNKVKTIGGICGIVVEVCDDNTVVIETGTEASGKSFLKLDKECIAQTDAKGPTQIAREEAEARRKAEKEAKSEKRAPEAAAAKTEEPEKQETQEAEPRPQTEEPAESGSGEPEEKQE